MVIITKAVFTRSKILRFGIDNQKYLVYNETD